MLILRRYAEDIPRQCFIPSFIYKDKGGIVCGTIDLEVMICSPKALNLVSLIKAK